MGSRRKRPIEEDFPHNPTNVYGRTKLVIEDMMRDFTAALRIKLCGTRYFNAAGAAEGGMIGEDHQPESHLIPFDFENGTGGTRPYFHLWDGLSYA